MSGVKAIPCGCSTLMTASANVLSHTYSAQEVPRPYNKLSKFNLAFSMTDIWPVYKILLSAASHVVSKKNT